ncbi:MAG TPA: ABC transporter [Fibrobacter sp.]|nr:ABC transporter [Fibrobacter sp.]
MDRMISVRGARLHNLKSINADFLANAINVVCGPSGCGKSTLVLDTLHGESRKRYLETLSPFALRVLGGKPFIPIDSASGLSPSIAIGASRGDAPPKSYAYTIANSDDAFHRLWAYAAKPTCPTCLKPMTSFTREEIVSQIAALPLSTRLQFLAPIETQDKSLDSLAAVFLSQGYPKALADGIIVSLSDLSTTEKNTIPKRFSLIIDRVIIRENTRTRIAEAVDACFRFTHSLLELDIEGKSVFYSTIPRCAEHKKTSPPLESSSFSPYKEESKQNIVLNSTLQGYSWKAILNTPFEKLEAILPTLFEGVLPEFLNSTAENLYQRIHAIVRLGLGYLSCGREGSTLSSGELQRLRLSSIATGYLNGMLICLDEPASGLHSKDIQKLWPILLEIKNQGNTLVLIEHNPDIISKADWIIEMGPEAGSLGGNILFQGPRDSVLSNPNSPTGLWLKKLQSAPLSKKIIVNKNTIDVDHFSVYDIEPIVDSFPVNGFSVITGESGSGKSSLLFKHIIPRFEKGEFKAVGIEAISFLSTGNFQGSRRSSVASAIQIFTPLREFFAKLPESKIRGYSPSRFGFHLPGGRCETCKGEGVIQDPFGYQEDECPVCLGKRFRDDILEVRFKSLSFAEILSLSVEQALSIFEAFEQITSRLKPLSRTGLGYLTLGQPTTHLSSGERARLRLSINLSKAKAPKTLYIFDEPARGLHEGDIHLMLSLINDLKKAGHTIIAIEQARDFLINADHILELSRVTKKN